MKRGTKTALIWGLLLFVVFFALLNRQRDDAGPTLPVTVEQALERMSDHDVSGYVLGDQKVFLMTSAGGRLAVPIDPSVMAQLAADGIPYVHEDNGRGSGDIVAWLLIPVVLIVALLYFFRK